MQNQTAKFLLASMALALLAVSALLVVGAALMPLPADLENSTPAAATIELRQQQSDPTSLASFAPAWSRNLRRPLTDDAVATTAPSDANVLPVRLVGTIFDPDHPRGIFVTMLGQMELRGVGEKTGGAEILRIDERSATLDIAGKSVVLKIEKTEVSIPGGGADPAQPASARSEPQFDPISPQSVEQR
jgi:hypothetical protein